MSVGVDSIDDDHKILIKLINELDEAIDADDSHELVIYVLNGLADYTQYHFAREEGLMAACRYPGFARHCKEHRDIRKQVMRFRESFNNNIIGGDDRKLLEFVRGWLSGHILGSDMAYAPYLRPSKKKPPKKTPPKKKRPNPGRSKAGRKPARRRGSKGRNLRRD